jgi:hypothetical protein
MARRSLCFNEAPGQRNWNSQLVNLRGREFSARLSKQGCRENALGGFGSGPVGLCFLFALVASDRDDFRKLDWLVFQEKEPS